MTTGRINQVTIVQGQRTTSLPEGYEPPFHFWSPHPLNIVEMGLDRSHQSVKTLR